MSLDVMFQQPIPIKKLIEDFGMTIEEMEWGQKFLHYNEWGIFLTIMSKDDENFQGLNTNSGECLGVFMDLIVPAFKVKFVDDEGIDKLYYEERLGKELDVDKLFDDTTKKYGYNIE